MVGEKGLEPLRIATLDPKVPGCIQTPSGGGKTDRDATCGRGNQAPFAYAGAAAPQGIWASLIDHADRRHHHHRRHYVLPGLRIVVKDLPVQRGCVRFLWRRDFRSFALSRRDCPLSFATFAGSVGAALDTIAVAFGNSLLHRESRRDQPARGDWLGLAESAVACFADYLRPDLGVPGDLLDFFEQLAAGSADPFVSCCRSQPSDLD